jgi:hypothetical protein
VLDLFEHSEAFVLQPLDTESSSTNCNLLRISKRRRRPPAVRLSF